MSSPGVIAKDGGLHLVTYRQVVALYGAVGAFLLLAGESGHSSCDDNRD